MVPNLLLTVTGIVVVVSPAALLIMLGLTTLFRYKLSEVAISRFAQTCSITGLIASLCVLAFMLATGVRDVPLEFGNWVSLHHLADTSDRADTTTGLLDSTPYSTDSIDPNVGDFHLKMKFVFDRLSIPFAVMTFVLCGVIGSFAVKYLHLEPGYNRFFLFYSIFQLGMVWSSIAGTIETLFFSWELVGLSSALLVAYYHDRASPVQNGLRVWAVYRIADAAFLVAALSLHHLSGSGDFAVLMGDGDWPFGKVPITEHQALLVGSLLLIAAAGKSALVPFSGWLPRAMEGPTPSSAVFYGALSVHLGAFLLLRVSPVLEASKTLSGIVVALGMVTMIYATMATRVQSDVKSALSYASLIQVSIIVVEIGFGLRYIPLIHIIGHACIRTLQLVRAPSLLKDYSSLENAIGDHLPASPTIWQRWLTHSTRERFYRFAWERGYMDSMLDDFVVQPFVHLFRMANRIELRCEKLLEGRTSSNDTAPIERRKN